MERIKRIDPAGVSALKRLLFAIGVSLLMHVWAGFFGLDRLRDGVTPALVSGIASPRVDVLAVSLQGNAAMPDAKPGMLPIADPQPSTINALRVPDARYYPVEELDVLPRPRESIRMPHATPGSGSVRLLTRIDASGRVIDVSVFDSGANATRTAVAVDAMRGCTFFAARRHGRPVRSEVVIELPAIART